MRRYDTVCDVSEFRDTDTFVAALGELNDRAGSVIERECELVPDGMLPPSCPRGTDPDALTVVVEPYCNVTVCVHRPIRVRFDVDHAVDEECE